MRPHITALDILFLWSIPGTIGAIILAQALSCSGMVCL